MKSKNNLKLSSDAINAKNNSGFAKAIKTLEFDKIQNILISYCPIESAHEKILSLTPAVSASEIKKKLKETSQAKDFINVKCSP